MLSTKASRGTTFAALAVALAVTAGCSGNSNNGTASPSASAAPSASSASATASDSGSPTSAPAKDPITLKVQFNATGPDFEGTDVYNEIVKQTGVTFKIERFDEEKFKVELAGGDLPDIIQVKNVNTTYLQQLIEGGSILPLDDLVKSNGPDIMAPVYAQSLDYSRKFWSNDTGKLYVIPMQIGKSGWGFDQQVGFNTRWDYYKELGYPEIKSIDDMVNVLADMVKKHPTTAEGKKGVRRGDLERLGYVGAGKSRPRHRERQIQRQ
ncbi:extracellular solute-binding protein [Cohnella rhizosphaerae]|uniref:Extracellular solute-binding protein n=1 Tax=Cohnella rhizosphaerae TaxID=1457232 RepID=A0A9X4QTY7_9BACL|nr:extracellular solute-binding protein [Cohnella rhizosphaerae]MDG0809922.1 extracellular solute-binding protein [Cohnella rhizosphaerae]